MTLWEKKRLPNQLTTLRIILTFIFMIFLFLEGLLPRISAFLLFTLASLTDLYDGRLARKYNIVSDFGKLMDPIADKILVLGAFMAFVGMQLIPAWMVIIIVARESFITGFRLIALKQGRVLAAEEAGKYKTVSQMVTIFVILLFLIAKELMLEHSAWNNDIEFYSYCGITILMGITLSLTVISGLSFISRNKNLMKL
ncbi:MAG: CDP-diacylglycerol--glycerol-3-phosphate 3-phosphatidyltransferase [Candidatus Omnitrophica bacterium CG11_big_fil_rev_8_21_14_0_20_42_13]|uniref:CDP-diacylglycerol--glycerol-3-phosphate 3-phosphatidyltransferase n=1 Tax=Candidatus Ghiorseimicrobium undicola TaxID=1974746 RepID=A0A2H0LWQ9_9BACT|nr:MAG: CDP-diacylglycerol--glycerol-3-phosphate 3-phosphatidyltransferase [Candidatus Omnitrophica bacterium CG11_big_fil_rev_8_21_14_0_20_42_13]